MKKTLLLFLLLPFLGFSQVIPAGTYVIGSSEPAPYKTLVTAIARINTSGISGPVTFLLDENQTVTSQITINQFTGSSAINTMTIKPNTGKDITISGNINDGAVLALNNADNIVIDGNNAISDNMLTIYNSNNFGYGQRAGIWFYNGSDGNKIQNLKINLEIESITTGILSVGIFAGGNSLDKNGNNPGNTIENVSFTNVKQAIMIKGQNQSNIGWNILNNKIESTNNNTKAFLGIYIFNAASCNVSGNTVSGIRLPSGVGSNPLYSALYLENLNNCFVTKNTISNIQNSAGYSSGYGIYIKGNDNQVAQNSIKNLASNSTNEGSCGIRSEGNNNTIYKNDIANIFSSEGVNTNGIYISGNNQLVYNNFINDVKAAGGGGTATQNGFGIYVNSGSVVKLYYNTVVLKTNQNEGVSAALFIRVGSNLDVQNNIFYNAQTSTSYQRYAIYSAVSNSAFTNIDNNDYFARTIGFLSSARSTLTDWKAATGKDFNSINILPTFVAASDLHLQDVVGNDPLKAATSITGITTDIDNEARAISPDKPYMGADERCALPSPAGTISGTATVCPGETNVPYTVPAITNATTYIWSYSGLGATIINSSTRTPTITFAANATSGNLTVLGVNACGNGTVSANFPVVVSTTPIVTTTASSSSINSGTNVTLTASASPSAQNAVLLSEGFNGTTNSWTKINNLTGGTGVIASWILRPDGYYYNYGGGFPARTFRSNDNSQFYLSNSAEHNGTISTILQSPVMNSVGYTSLSLDFFQYYLDYDNTDSATIQVSTNGTSWTTLSTTTTTQGAENNFLKTTINLDAYINQATLYVRFKYDANYDWFWAIDNVTVSGNKPINYTYSWTAAPAGTAGLPSGAGTSSASNSSIVASPTVSTTYTLTATNPNGGCTGSSTVMVTVLPACVFPENTISSLSAVCANTPFTLSLQNTSAAATAYQWQTSLDNISWSNVTAIPFFNSNFTSIPAITNVYGNASVTGGELVLTTAVNSQTGGYVIQSTPGTNINSFTASFDYRMFGGNGADGMSLSYGSNIGNNQGGGEEGEGTGLILKFDSYDNTSNTTASQIRIFYGGIQIFFNTLNSFDLRNLSYRNVLLTTDGNGLLSLKIGATTIVSGLSLPAGYLSSNKSNWKFKFSARTGGLNDRHSIDNLSITYLDSTFTTSQTVPTYYRSIVTCGGSENTSIPVLVTMDPMPPTLGEVKNLTCIQTTGSVVLSGLPTSGTVKQTGFVTKSYPITATTMTISGLAVGDYYFAVNNETCESVISSVVTIVDKSSTTWNGSGWSNGEPSITSRIIFAGNYDSTKDLIGCDCTVNSGANVVFKYINPTLGHTLTVTNDVKVLGSGKLTFENNASLVQTANSITNTNSGKITYQRQTSPYKPFDYIYWSSPVVGQILGDVSPLTPLDKFYSFDVATYDWKPENPNSPMTNGVGYIIRGADYVLPTPPGLHQASFFGIPNNGLITVTIPSTAVNSESSALLGNPYPSALDANEFLKGNTSILEGTLYFWTHNTAIQNVGNITNGSQGSGALAYTSDDYATYNLTGGVTVVSTGNIVAGTAQTVNKPSGKIASGQSFFAGINSVAGTVKFENSMRVGVGSLTGDNTQFFRTASGKSDVTSAYENHRVWLNLTNTEGAFKQLLVGYITGATNAYDPFFDGVSFNGNEFVDFYSITDDETLTIQGRALPFDENDSVLLGYSSAIEGDFSISIDEVDGLLVGQNIYLEDKLNNSIHNLTKEAYTFQTTKGTFDDRFVLRYTDKTLGTGDFDTTNMQVLVSVKNKQIKINSSVESIDKVLIFDILGKQIFSKINVGTTEFVIPNLGSSEQVLIVKTLLQNGQTVITKLIY